MVVLVVVAIVVPRKSLFYICKVEMANKRCSQYACLSFSNALVALVDYSTIDNVQYVYVGAQCTYRRYAIIWSNI